MMMKYWFMEIKTNDRSFFIFDLDDTLYPEISYLQSAYRHIAGILEQDLQVNLYDEMISRYRNRENVFGWLTSQYQSKIEYLTTDWLLGEYRGHMPAITLNAETDQFLQQVRQRAIATGLITDGRSITQRNKLKALGLAQFFADVIISEEFGSEKPNEKNFTFFQQKYPGKEFYFFGDNTSKDFIVPVKLGWTTICLKDTGSHIHKQDFERQPQPAYTITSFRDIKLS